MPRSIALVSCAEARHHDTDLSLIIRALQDRGIVAEITDWDNAAEDWSRFSAAIIRSPWDYHRIVKWNTDKTYLGEMVDAGIPVIPTTFVRGAEDLVLITNDGMLDRDIVVKPTISAGSNNTERHMESPVKAAAHLGSLIDAGKVAMVQPYQRFIDERGETGMVYFNGDYSHAFRKGAILATGDNVKNGLYTEEDISSREASSQERELGEQVMDFIVEKFGYAPLYARVDVVRGSAGVPVLMELELAEPSLYLHMDKDAGTRFASAVVTVTRQ